MKIAKARKTRYSARLLVYSVVLGFGKPLFAQSVTLQGKITCENMLVAKCVGGIHVSLKGPGDYSGKSDEHGNFRIDGVPNKLFGKKVRLTLKRGNAFIRDSFYQLRKEKAKKTSRGERYIFNLENLEIDCFSCDENESVILKSFKRLTWGVASVIGYLVNESLNASGNQSKIKMGSGHGSPFPTHLEPEFSKSKIRAGEFIFYAFSTLTASPGFSFSPTMNEAQSIFTNSAAMLRAPDAEAQVFSNFNNQIDLGLLIPIGSGFALGLGYLGLRQEEPKRIVEEAFGIDYTKTLETMEQAYFIAAALKISPRLSLGITTKYISQSVEIPSIYAEIYKVPGDTLGLAAVLVDASQDRVDSGYYDIDLGANFEMTPGLNLGISLMNLAGTKLLAGDNYIIADSAFFRHTYPDPFPQNETTLRAFGAGLSYQNSKTHYGADFTINEDGKAAFALGVLYKPFPRATLNAGYTSEYDTLAVTARYSFISYTFNKNNALGNSHYAGLLVRF